MIASATISAASDRLVRIRSEAPLVVRPTPEAVYLVGGAAGPLGGDHLSIDVDVADGADLVVRTVAASVALPGPAPSHVTMRARVGAGCSLVWRPEPTVVAAGCRHEVDAAVELDGSARLEWWEELVLGRHGEPPGAVRSRLSVDIGDEPLLRHELSLGPGVPGWDGPAVAGHARVVGSVVMVDPAWVVGGPPPARVLGPHAARLPLDGPAVQIVALGTESRSVRMALDALRS